MNCAPYPWHALDSISRQELIALRAARRSLSRNVDPLLLEAAFADVARARVEFLCSRLWVPPRAWSPPDPKTECLLTSLDGRQKVLFSVDPDLAATLVAGVLGRRAAWVDRTKAVPDTVQGSVGALALAIVRRASGGQAMCLEAVGPDARARFCRTDGRGADLAADFTVLLSGEAFWITLEASVQPLPTQDPALLPPLQLQTLGMLPISLPVVGAVAALSSTEVKSLRPGDALAIPESKLVRRANAKLEGMGLLCAPCGEVGLPVKLLDERRLVLGEGTMSVDAEFEASSDTEEEPQGMSTADVLGDAPLAVRVEMANVTLTAREWAALRPGDVIRTGRRLGERVVLRVSGHEVARGELVDVEGELGVRISELRKLQDGGTP